MASDDKRLRVAFFGAPMFAVPTLRAVAAYHEVVVAITQPDKPAGRGRRMTAPPVKEAAIQLGVPVEQPTSARRPELVDMLESFALDVAVVVAYGKILPGPVLSVPEHGFLNVHGSLLPEYRGAAPIQRAIMNGETTSGVTIMRLDEGMDTGPMLLADSVDIGPDDTARVLHDKLAPRGARLMVDALNALVAGTLVETPQDDARATYAPKLTKEDGQVAWDRPAREVHNLVRGVDPWPGATTTFEGGTVKLFGATLAEGTGPPGQVLRVERDRLVVACGDGACGIGALQLAGRKRLPAKVFAHGARIGSGSMFR